MKRRRIIGVAIAVVLLVALLSYFRFRYGERAPEVIEPAAAPAPAETTPVPPEPSPSATESLLPSAQRKRLSDVEIENLRGSAKIALAANYAAQKSFFAEYGRYSTDLAAVGFFPENFPLGYKAGFLQPFRGDPIAAISEDPRRMDIDALLADFPQDRENPQPFYTPAAEKISLGPLEHYCQLGCTANDRSFEMLIAFNLDDDPTLEVWRINDKKELEQVVDDTKE